MVMMSKKENHEKPEEKKKNKENKRKTNLCPVEETVLSRLHIRQQFLLVGVKVPNCFIENLHLALFLCTLEVRGPLAHVPALHSLLILELCTVRTNPGHSQEGIGHAGVFLAFSLEHSHDPPIVIRADEPS